MNTLYYGDNLEVLRKYIKDETVDLCYIDPPFNSKRNYNQIYNNIGGEDRAQAQAFTDTWTWDDHANDGLAQILGNDGGRFNSETVDLIKGLMPVLKRGSLLAYLIAMTVRAVEIHRVLKPTGSFYLHCDPTASHYLKLVCDAIFVTQGGDYRNEIIWKRTSNRKSVNQFGRIHDVILYYTKSQKQATWTPPQVVNTVRGHDVVVEDGVAYRLSDLSGGGVGEARLFNGVLISPPSGRHWMYDQEQINQFLAEGKIVLNRKGVPRLKKMVTAEGSEMSVGDLWNDIEPLNSAAKERLGYPTQKPEALLERIISASSNEGDVVLDAFCGCGTTIAVAQRLKRRWIGIDITYQSIAVILRRLQDTYKNDPSVMQNIMLNGIPQDMESAKALALKKDDRVRKEFEKWAVLTYTDNRAVINEKKGADAGIDGTAYFQTSSTDNAKVVFQVKSGNVGRGDVAKLRGDMEREGAAMATLITLQEATGPMRAEAKGAGVYVHPLMGRSYDKIQIVTAQEIIEQDKRLDLPLSLEVLKAAQQKASSDQLTLIEGD